MAATKKRAKKPINQCKRCECPSPVYDRGFCPTCVALVDAAISVSQEAKPPLQAFNPKKKRPTSPEVRAAASLRLKQYWADVRAGLRPKPKGGFTQPETQQRIHTLRTGKIPSDVMAELENRAKAGPEVRKIVHADPKHAVQQELAERELARRKLVRFIIRNNPRYLAGWFHIDLCERLERFYEDCWLGKSPRLMIFAPPRSGKSKIVSEVGPAYGLGRYPDLEIIAASYGSELARDFSYKVQERIRSADYQLLFPRTKLRPGKESVDSWMLAKSAGRYIAAGVGGPLTGKGAHALLIDDPFKNREEADSALTRQSIWNWYTSTAYTRLAPGGGVLLMHTRWHDDDMAGRLLAEMKTAEKQFEDSGTWPDDADRWEVVSYPAIAVEDEKHRRVGEALHPERYPLSALLKIKRTLGPRDWSALYQQNPVPDEGGYFSQKHMRYYDAPPATDMLSIYAAADLAISKKDSADFTVMIVAGLDRDGNIWLLDLVRGRFDSAEIIDAMFDIQRRWKPRMFGVEEGAIATAIGPFLEKRMQEEKMYALHIEPLKIKKMDKEARARPIQGRMAQGKVMIPKTADWTSVLVEELVRFPTAVRNDCVDALAWIGQMLMMMNVSFVAGPIKQASWRDKMHEAMNVTSNGLGAMAA
jgi:predicted phage terminase large subunit-like protein